MSLLPKEERTRHLIVKRPGSVSATLRSELALSPEKIAELLYWGGVYLNKKRITVDAEVTRDDYLRVHLQPRRFPEAQRCDWSSRIVAQNEDFVWVNKPAEVPSPPTLDNLHENVLACVSKALGAPLWITHRLDLPTQGLMVLARTPRAQSIFNKWLNEGRVTKHYRALVEKAVPVGTVVHWQKQDPAAPKIVSPDRVDGWSRCELEILEVAERGKYFETKIRLVTGRTHQIRCQLAALGAPILGDTLYGGSQWDGGVALQAFHLSLPDRATNGTLTFELPYPWPTPGDNPGGPI